MDKEKADFYRKYASRLNHLRDVNLAQKLSPEIQISTTDFLFSQIGNSGPTVLIQGDSWAEQFIQSHASYVALEMFSESHNMNFVVAGITSFSPTPMAVQYRLLKRDFNIAPKVVVGTIDQTDIGDELCRYRKQIDRDEDGEFVHPYGSDEMVPYSVGPYFKMIDILESNKPALIRLIKYKVEKLRNLPLAGCSAQQMMSGLKNGLSDQDRSYFLERVLNYISTVLGSSGDVERLVLVTHFHKGHLDGTYALSVGNLVAEAISESPYKDRIVHLNIEPDTYSKQELANIFLPDDVYSHLTPSSHRRYFVQPILKIVEQLLVK